MAITFEGESEAYTSALDFLNYIFSAIFLMEAVLKLIAQGISYFYSSWQKFDFFVVCASMVDILMS